MRGLVLGVVLVASAAWAQTRSVQLYVVSKQVVLLKEAKARAAHVLTLHQGDAVTWTGETHDGFLLVERSGKKGYLPRFELTPSRPQAELSEGGKPIAAQAFAEGGFIKCRMPGPSALQAYRQPEEEKAAVELQQAEELTQQRVTQAELEKKARQLNP
ncbi:MAG TPA: hypothetical protein VGE37_05610 [Archangium sp.]